MIGRGFFVMHMGKNMRFQKKADKKIGRYAVKYCDFWKNILANIEIF